MDRHTRHITGSVAGMALGIHNALTPEARRGIGILIVLGTAAFLALGGMWISFFVHLGDVAYVRRLLGGTWIIGTFFLLAPWAALVAWLGLRLRRGTGSRRALVAGIVASAVAIGAAQAHNGVVSEIAFLYANPGKDRGYALGCPAWLAAHPGLEPDGKMEPFWCLQYLPQASVDAACLRVLSPLKPISGGGRLLCWQRAKDFMPPGAYWPQAPRQLYASNTGLREAAPTEMRAAVAGLREALAKAPKP